MIFKKTFVGTFVGTVYSRHTLPAPLRTNVFHLKMQFFVDLKFNQDPDPLGFTLVWLPGSRDGLGSAPRKKGGSGSGSALKPMRIHNNNTTKK
jgi:hypothetical protein